MSTQTAACADNPFDSNPAGPFFAGRVQQLSRLRLHLQALHSQPQHMCVVGRAGEGKTSFLQQTLREAADQRVVACKCNLDASKAAEADIKTVFEALLSSVDQATGQELLKNWEQGGKSVFRTAQHPDQVRTDDLLRDFESIRNSVRAAGRHQGCVICVDEGQRIHPVALSALRNALQNIGAGYMLVLALRNVSLDASNVVEGPRIIEDIANRSEDTGLPRLFGNNYASLGPFDTQQEADECIRKRLASHTIQFGPSVISDIGRVTGRFPKTMMDLSNEVYTLAQIATPTIQVADETLLTQAFVSVYRNLVDEATEFVAPYTNTKRMVMRIGLEHAGNFTPLQVARSILKGTTALNEDAFADDPVSIALDQLVAGRYCLKKGAEYQWAEPLRTHSLRLSLI